MKSAFIAAFVVATFQQCFGKLTFIAIGDWGTGGTAQHEVAEAMGKWTEQNGAIDFIISTGDNFYETGVTSVTDSKWENYWKNVYNHTGIANKVWYPSLGNHDHSGSNEDYQPAKYFYKYKTESNWHMPASYYSYYRDIGNGMTVHFVALDTQNRGSSTQRNWFQNEISHSSADWIIVYGHHQVYSSGQHSSSSTLFNYYRPTMKSTNTAFYICGHDHNLEYIQKTNPANRIIDYVVTGAGAKLRSMDTDHHNDVINAGYTSDFYENNGFAVFEIQGNQALVTFVDKNGNVLKTFCKQNPRRSDNNTPFCQPMA